MGVLERLLLDHMLTSCKSRGAILQVSFSLIKEWVSLGISRISDRLYVDQALPFVAIARVCEVNCAALDDQRSFPYEYNDGVLIVLMTRAPLKRILLDGTGESYDDGVETCPVYHKELESRSLRKAFAVWRGHGT